MKRFKSISLSGLIFAIFALFFATAAHFPHAIFNADAAEQQQIFGLIKENAILLNQQKAAITSLPASYFVEIVGVEGQFFAVEYGNLSGYVLSTQIEQVDYEPKTKLHSGYFTAKNDTFPTNIRVLPNSAAAVAATVPLNQKAYLYGTIAGEALIASAGTTWYYVEYNGALGYAYCAHGTADQIAANVIEKVEKPIDLTAPDDPSPKIEWTLALAIAIPAIVVMLALFSRPKKQVD